jgi:hypothetical protein
MEDRRSYSGKTGVTKVKMGQKEPGTVSSWRWSRNICLYPSLKSRARSLTLSHAGNDVQRLNDSAITLVRTSNMLSHASHTIAGP